MEINLSDLFFICKISKNGDYPNLKFISNGDYKLTKYFSFSK